MPRPHILVIEDDAAIRLGILDSLQFEGYRTLEASRGDSGLEIALRANYDLLLLDLVLPGKGGLEILEEVRAERPSVPIIIMTARGAEADRVRGLKLGADDYVVKPFSVKELIARVEAVLRRSPERPQGISQIALPGGVAHLDRREIQFEDGGRVELSEREIDILRYLASHPDRAIAREELLTRVWHIDPRGIHSRTIDMHIARLREKLRDNAAEPQLILTVRGKGYMLALKNQVG